VAIQPEHPTVPAPPARARASERSWRARLASIEAAAIAGIVCAIGWSISLRGLLAAPAIDAPEAEVARYYGDPDTGFNALVLLQVHVLATIAFLWFIGVVRSRLGPRAPRLAGTVFFGGGILIAGLLFVGTGALAAPAVLVEAGGKVPGPGEASMMRALAVAVLSVFTPRIATLIMFATATLARKTGALPRWLVILTYAVGAFEFLNVTISQPTIYVFPAWIALVSVVLLRRKATGDLDVGPPPARSPA
jgi:hypothetical protein